MGNLIFGGVRTKVAWKLIIDMEDKTQNRQQEVSADKNGRLIQAVAHYCGTSPAGSNSTTWQIRRVVKVLEKKKAAR